MTRASPNMRKCCELLDHSVYTIKNHGKGSRLTIWMFLNRYLSVPLCISCNHLTCDMYHNQSRHGCHGNVSEEHYLECLNSTYLKSVTHSSIPGELLGEYRGANVMAPCVTSGPFH